MKTIKHEFEDITGIEIFFVIRLLSLIDNDMKGCPDYEFIKKAYKELSKHDIEFMEERCVKYIEAIETDEDYDQYLDECVSIMEDYIK